MEYLTLLPRRSYFKGIQGTLLWMCYCLSQWRDRSLAAEDVLANEDVLTHQAAFPSAPASKPQPAAAAGLCVHRADVLLDQIHFELPVF